MTKSYNEIMDATEALINWFESQEIDDMEAISVMLKLMAATLASRAPTVADLHEGLSYASDALKHNALACHIIKQGRAS